jgi:hypothetical protein
MVFPGVHGRQGSLKCLDGQSRSCPLEADREGHKRRAAVGRCGWMIAGCAKSRRRQNAPHRSRDLRERPAAGPKQRTFKVTLTALGFSLLLTICRVRRLTSAARALSLRPVRALNVANQVNQGCRLIGISTTHAAFRSPTWQTEAKCEVKARRTIGAECIMDGTGNCR